MFLIDTHTHLYLDQFKDDRNQVVLNAIEKGIIYMLLPSIDSSSFKSMHELSNQFPENCLPMIGLHPTSVNENFQDELKLVEQELEKGGYCAVGEIGIDLYWDKTFKNLQEEAFRQQLKFAKEYMLPVSIHTRDAFDEIYSIVKEEKTESLKGVFHCFTGTEDQAKKILDIGFFMGIGGVVTFKNSKLDKVLEKVPLRSIVLETDAPFLTPSPHRGKRNESAYTALIAERIAEIKQVSIEDIAFHTSENAMQLFNLAKI